MTTTRVGPGEVSDAHVRGRLELVGCAEGLELREEKRERPGDCFRRPKTSDVCPAIMPLLFNGWAFKRTPNAMKLDKRSIYTIIRPHANFKPNPRTFSDHL